MRKFIIISLLNVSALPVLACAGGGTYNYYLFKMTYSSAPFIYAKR